MFAFHNQGSESTVLKNRFTEASEPSSISFPPVLPRLSLQPAFGGGMPTRRSRAPHTKPRTCRRCCPASSRVSGWAAAPPGAWGSTSWQPPSPACRACPCPARKGSSGQSIHAAASAAAEPRSLKAIAKSCSSSPGRCR